MKEWQKGHQGDVQFTEVNKLPKEVKKIENTPLAYGEVSGHLHIIDGDVTMFEDTDGYKYAVVGSDGASIQHTFEQYLKSKEKPIADHKPIQLKANSIYKFAIQQGYNPYEKIFQNVGD